MFCSNCGARVPEAAAFCTSCGSQAKHLDPPPAAPSPVPPPPAVAPAQPPMAPPPSVATYAPAAPPHTPPGSQVKCEWCGAIVDSSQTSCPKCGATLNTKTLVTRSGWAKLPGRKDMAKLQFGDSICQIEGLYVPVADVKLAPSDTIYFTHHILLWKDPQIQITTMSLRGGWKRMFAGMPLIMTQASGPGHIAFSRDAPGEMIALPIHPGQAVDVREHLFMLATSNVAYDWFSTNVWFTTGSGDDKETQYPLGMFMDRFTTAQTPGLLLLHAAGNVFVRELAVNQTILVKPTALIFKDPSVQMQLHFDYPHTSFSGWRTWGNRYMWLRLYGPGRIAVQSVFDRAEGENGIISSCSSATERRW